MPGLLGGLERAVKAAADRINSPKGAAAIAASVVGTVLGVLAYRRIQETAAHRQLYAELGETDIENPHVVVLYSNNTESSASLKSDLLDQGYAVVAVETRAAAVEVIRRFRSISAIVHERGAMPPKNNADDYIPALSIPANYEMLSGDAKERFLNRLEGRVRAHYNESYSYLRQVARHVERLLEGNEFPEVKGNVAIALRKLANMHEPIMRRDKLESHRGGVRAATISGSRIDAESYYSRNGFFIKLERRDVPEELDAVVREIWDDWKYSSSPGSEQVAGFAKPYFHARISPDEEHYVGEYCTGPTVSEAFILLKGLEDQAFARSATERTLDAVFNIAIKYHRYKREKRKREERPLGREKIRGILDGYVAESLKAYERLSALVPDSASAGFTDALNLLTEPMMHDERLFGRTLDMMLTHFKLKLPRERVNLEELRDFFKEGGRAKTERDIEAGMSVYDQGFRDRNYLDNFVTAAFSAYHGRLDERWIDRARRYLLKEFRLRAGLSALFPVSEMIHPRIMGYNLLAMAAYKLLRLAYFSINTAIEAEHDFLQGQIRPQEHDRLVNMYINNAVTYASSLAMMARTAAIYFESNPNGVKKYGQLWVKLKDAYKCAESGEAGLADNDISKRFMVFYEFGNGLAGAENGMRAMIQKVREGYRHIAEFKAAA